MGVVKGLTGKRKDGTVFAVDVSLGVPAPGQEGYTVAFIRDITERQQHEDQLLHQATHDGLTGLPNRSLFLDRLRQAIARGGGEDNRVAVLILDLDNFKTINDSFGDAFGNDLLVEIAQRLKNVLKDEDILARLGGDEFGILLSSLDRAGDASVVAEKVLLNFSVPCRVNDQAVIVGGSLGSSFFPDDAADGETLLRYADVAMFQAKQLGRGTYVAFSGSMDRRIQEDLRLHVRLKHALDNNGLRLLYQPQVDTETGEIVGSEALLRWRDDELGEVSPARFIPVAEATGLILPIGDWVIDTACRQIALWSNTGTPLKVAINLSPQQLHQQKLVGKIRQVLDSTGALAGCLEIEVTEMAAMENPELAQQQLSELGGLGIGIALDDFGTGYSSLGYLKNLPITKLKIDQSFVRGLPGDRNDVSIVHTIIGLAKSLNLRLVAEGVETDEQRRFLQQYGCETYQGWLFSKAVLATELGAMLLVQSGGDRA
jgi:diguanylate cyclase (GGDEF)-like protein